MTPAYYIHFHKASIPVYDNLNGRRVKENILRERNREISARIILTYIYHIVQLLQKFVRSSER